MSAYIEDRRISTLGDLFDDRQLRKIAGDPRRVAMLEATRAYITKCNPEIWLLQPLAAQCVCEDAAMGFRGLVTVACRDELGISPDPLRAIMILLGITTN